MMKEHIVIVGYGAHAKTLADSIRAQGKYQIIGYTEKNKNENGSYTYLGDDSCLREIFESGCKNAVIGVGQIANPSIRIKLHEYLEEIGFSLPVIIDPSAVIGKDVTIGEGTFVGKGVIIESGSVIGKECIINTKTMISHDGKIGDFSHVTVANICGGASVGNFCFVGAGATVISGVNVGNNVIVGAGTIVIKDVEDNMKVINKIIPIITKRKDI